jgi:arylsulfatase A-like enzyme
MGTPNVLYILSDEHFGGAMGHAGDPNVRTPHLDELAERGVSFSRAYANCPICTPSRGTIFSGRHAHAGPVQGFFDVFKATAPSTATLLRGAGYHTAYFGKWHCGAVHDQRPKDWDSPRNNGHFYQNRTPEMYRAGYQDWFAFEINTAPLEGFYYHQDDRVRSIVMVDDEPRASEYEKAVQEGWHRDRVEDVFMNAPSPKS